MTYQKNIDLTTNKNGDMHDITGPVQHVVRQSGVKTGIAHAFVVGSTAAIGAIEFESGLERDLPELLNKYIPPSTAYGHEEAWHDGNGHSHLQATLLGPSVTVPISEGKLNLGTWQQLFLLECDVRERRRTIVVTIHGD